MVTFRQTCSLACLLLGAGMAQADLPRSSGILEFGPDNTLFLADAASGAIHAYTLPAGGTPPEQDTAFNLLDVDALVAEAIGATGRIVYSDLAVHPVTRAAYVSLTATVAGELAHKVAVITPDGGVSDLDLAALEASQFSIDDGPDPAVSFWRDIPAPSLTVTDLDYVDGELFVAGISTGEFASTLRRVPYPFDGSAGSTSIEMYHAAHDQNETRAPIRAMTVVELDGAPTVVAAYTCTPLVTVPVDSLTDGAHVFGKTVAELGYGNTPLDVVPFAVGNRQGGVDNYVLVVNREMDADLIALGDLATAAAAPGLTEPVPYLGATSGVTTVPLPLSGVVHVADQDAQFLLGLRRDLDTGAMELVSFRKGAFFRLSDFISEYNFPDYAYASGEASDGLRMFQNMLKADEGFPGQIRQ
ncbi:MAG: hypothetical protein AAF281_07775 [Pseudomonadota bacterium]